MSTPSPEVKRQEINEHAYNTMLDSASQPPAPVDVPDSEGGLENKFGLLHNPVADTYFSPKHFETESLYRKLGVTAFKKIVPTGGDYAARLIRRVKPDFSLISPPTAGESREERVAEYEGFTRVYESIHLGGFAVMGAMQAEVLLNNPSWGIVAMQGFLQASLNVYPIMLQRYNRLRIDRFLSRNK